MTVHPVPFCTIDLLEQDMLQNMHRAHRKHSTVHELLKFVVEDGKMWLYHKNDKRAFHPGDVTMP